MGFASHRLWAEQKQQAPAGLQWFLLSEQRLPFEQLQNKLGPAMLFTFRTEPAVLFKPCETAAGLLFFAV